MRFRDWIWQIRSPVERTLPPQQHSLDFWRLWRNHQNQLHLQPT